MNASAKTAAERAHKLVWAGRQREAIDLCAEALMQATPRGPE